MAAEHPHHLLTAGPYEGVVTEVGGALHTLKFEGRDLVSGFYGNVPLPNYRGAILVPWPNRIADGRYQFEGRPHQLPINEVARGCAIHGLAAWDSWTVLDEGPANIRLAHTIWPRPGYPFTLEVEAEYRLDEKEGLDITVSARNSGLVAAPYGVSIHPYLVAGAGRADDWTLQLDADTMVDADPVRLLPTGESSVAGTEMDFRSGRRIGATKIDNAFTDLAFDAATRVTASLTAAGGHGVRLGWDQACRWVQVYTTDRTEPDLDRIAVAVEPMTCPPDAFNSGLGLIVLQPGDSNRVSWQIAAI